MSDRFPAWITIGGELNEQTLVALAQAAQDDGAGTEWDAEIADAKTLRAAITAGEPIRLHNPEASYGRFEDLERCCREHNLAYRRHSAAWSEHDAELATWWKGMDEPVCVAADQAGNRALVPLEELQDALAAGQTLADVIAGMELAVAEIPPLRFVPAMK